MATKTSRRKSAHPSSPIAALRHQVEAKKYVLAQVGVAASCAITDLSKAQALLNVLLLALRDRAEEVDHTMLRLALFAQADSIKSTLTYLVPIHQHAKDAANA